MGEMQPLSWHISAVHQMWIEKPNKCDICEYSFARNKDLQNHIEYAHGKPSRNEKNYEHNGESEKNEIFSFDKQSENENYCGGDGKKPIYYIRMSIENGIGKSDKSRPVQNSLIQLSHMPPPGRLF